MMHKIRCRCLVPLLSWLLLSLFAACGKPEPWATVQRSFDENFADLQRLEASRRLGDTATFIEIEKSMGGLFYNLQHATPAQRAALHGYLQRPRPPALPAQADVNPYSYQFTLNPRQSVRLPVRSYCLNLERKSPDRTLRYRLSTLQRESPARRLVFRFQRDVPRSNVSYQRTLWDVVVPERRVFAIPGFVEILTYYQIPYTPMMTVAELEQSAAFQQRYTTLGLDEKVDISSLHLDLISTGGASSGELVIYNIADDPIPVRPEHLQLRFVPERMTARVYTLSGKETEPLPQFQNIMVDGLNHDVLDVVAEKKRVLLQRSLETLEHLDSSALGAQDKDALRTLFNFGLDMLSQGELEEGARVVNQVDRWSALDVLDWATLLIPGVNDFRDIYEAVTGVDLITGEPLEWWERGLSMAGVAIGSGAEFRKIADGILRQAKPGVSTNSADNMVNAAQVAIDLSTYAATHYPAGIWAPSGRSSNPALRAAEHWIKHRSEFPEFTDARGYIDAAHAMARQPPAGTLSRVAQDGSLVLYHEASNTLLIVRPDRLPHTLYRPSPHIHEYPTNIEFFRKHPF